MNIMFLLFGETFNTNYGELSPGTEKQIQLPYQSTSKFLSSIFWRFKETRESVMDKILR